jgi:hypothetical protein
MRWLRPYGFLLLIIIFSHLHSRAHAEVRSLSILYSGVEKNGNRVRVHAWLKSRGYRAAGSLTFAPIERWVFDPKLKSISPPANEADACAGLAMSFGTELIQNCAKGKLPNSDGDTPFAEAHSKSGASGVENESAESCSLLPAIDGTKVVRPGLSVFWAQEYVGMDLAYQRWQSWAGQQKKQATSKGAGTARVLALDTSLNQHGANIQKILQMNTPPDSARSPGGQQRIDFIDANSKDDKGWIYLEALDRHPNGLDVVNLSMNNLDDVLYSGLQRYSRKHNTLFAVGAGNQFPDFERSKKFFADGIYVGNLEASGFMNLKSSAFDAVEIAAPSGSELVIDNPSQPFSGTSGAAAMVSSALALLKSVLPDISVAQTRELLRATALPTWNAFEKEPRLNGAGTLNSLGLLEVGIKIRETCTNEAGAFKPDCFKNTLKETTAGASLDSPLLQQVETVFGCEKNSGHPKNAPQVACSIRKDLLSSLRRAAFAAPRVGRYWKALECIHRGAGLNQNAEFYGRLAKIGWPSKGPGEMQRLVLKEIKNLKKSEFKADEIERLQYFLSKDKAWVKSTELKKLVTIHDREKKFRELEGLVISDQKQQMARWKIFLNDPDTEVRKMSFQELRKIPFMEDVKTHALRSLKDSEEEVRLEAFRYLMGEVSASHVTDQELQKISDLAFADKRTSIPIEAIRLLKTHPAFSLKDRQRLVDRALSHPSADVKIAGLLVFENYETGLQKIRQAADGDEVSRWAAMQAVEKLNSKDALVVLDQGLRDKDFGVRMVAVAALLKVEDAGVEQRLSLVFKDGEHAVRETTFNTVLAKSAPRAMELLRLNWESANPERQSELRRYLSKVSATEMRLHLAANSVSDSDFNKVLARTLTEKEKSLARVQAPSRPLESPSPWDAVKSRPSNN